MSGDGRQVLANGRYQLDAVLGQGGMATVYRATDTALQVQRAIKVLAQDFTGNSKIRKRFITEARTLARLRHPNVITVFDVGFDEEQPFIVMEIVEGGSLGDLIRRSVRLPVGRACGLLCGSLRGVQVAHDHGVVHRDLKPENILITVDGLPKVTDFGIAHVEDLGLTRTGAVMGTLAFMAPEQYQDARHAEARSDIFAIGATLYEAVTGREPFGIYASNVQDQLLKGIPDELAEVIRKACQYRPEDRYGSATEMEVALARVAERVPADFVVPGVDFGTRDADEARAMRDRVAASDRAAGLLPSLASVEPAAAPEEPVVAAPEEPVVATPEAPVDRAQPSRPEPEPPLPGPPSETRGGSRARTVVYSLALLGLFLVLALPVALGLVGGGVLVATQLDPSDDGVDGTSTVEHEVAPADDTGQDVPSAEVGEGAADPVEEAPPPPPQPPPSNGQPDGAKDQEQVSDGETAPVEDGQEEGGVEEPTGGTLHVRATGGTIFVDDTQQSTTGVLQGFRVEAGSARIRVVHQETGEAFEYTVTFDNGEVRRLKCDFDPAQCVEQESSD